MRASAGVRNPEALTDAPHPSLTGRQHTGDAAGVVGRREDVVSQSSAMVPEGAPQPPVKKKDRTHYLYIAVIAAVVAGVTVGLVAPDLGKALKPLGTGFVELIKMMISPVIFCTIVLDIAMK